MAEQRQVATVAALTRERTNAQNLAHQAAGNVSIQNADGSSTDTGHPSALALRNEVVPLAQQVANQADTVNTQHGEVEGWHTTVGEQHTAIMALAPVIAQQATDVAAQHGEVMPAAEQAVRAANAVRSLAANLAGALGASGDARVLLGSTANVWAEATRLTEEVTGAAVVQATADGPQVEFSGAGAVAWTLDITSNPGVNPLADATALAVVAHANAPGSGGTATPEQLDLALTVEVIGPSSKATRYAGAAEVVVPGHPEQVMAAEAVSLLNGTFLVRVGTDGTRGNTVRVTLSAALPADGKDVSTDSAVVRVALAAAPYVLALHPDVEALIAEVVRRTAETATLGSAMPIPAAADRDWFITVAGSYELPLGENDGDRLTVWHAIASGTVSLTAPSGQAISNPAGNMTQRGQHRRCVFYDGRWHCS